MTAGNADDRAADRRPPDHPAAEQARQIVRSLVAAGVSRVAYCPGSRNAPLAFALASAEQAGWLSVHPFSDERSAVFWTLGVARGSAPQPVAVVTTSGTAVTELHSGLTEAKYQALPIVAITADRPSELHGVGASQTIEQRRIFGPSVTASQSLSAPREWTPEVAADTQARIDRLLAVSRQTPGPVHLNVAFRDPLLPREPWQPGPLRSGLSRRKSAGRSAASALTGGADAPPTRPTGTRAAPGVPRWEDVVDPQLRTVVVAGDSADPLVAQHAALRSVPLLAEPNSGVTQFATWIAHAPWLLEPLAEADQKPEQVVVTGRPTLSRTVSRLLADPAVRKVVVSDRAEYPDVSRTAACVVPAFAPPTTPAAGTMGGVADGWLASWRSAAAAAERAIAAALAEGEADRGLNLFAVARAVWATNREVPLWLAASNSARGFDLGAALPGRPAVFANRGVAGIDGSIATARGLATGLGRPVRAVLGDLAFAADLSSLAQNPVTRLTGAGLGAGAASSADRAGLTPKHSVPSVRTAPGRSLSSGLSALPPPPVHLVVLDDAGGGIFQSLEYGGIDPDTYERYFAVPPQVDIVAAARACGWRADTVSSLAELQEALAGPIETNAVTHVPVPRPARLMEQLGDDVAQAVRGEFA